MVSSIAFKLIDLQPQSTEGRPSVGLDVCV
jgi:hypothetical protein